MSDTAEQVAARVRSQVSGVTERIETGDGAILSVRSFPSEAPGQPVLVLNGGFGIRKMFYYRFARYLQARGVSVVTYDYRGVGESSCGPARILRLRDWIELDFPAVLAWSQRRFVGRRTLVVGHSFGGQLVGYLPALSSVAAIAMVCSPIEDCRRYGAKARAYLFMHRKILIPLTSKLLGYYPGKRLRVCENLPSSIAEDWCRFSGGDIESLGLRREANAFADFSGSVLAISVADDFLASRGTVDAMADKYLKAEKLRWHLGPGEPGGRAIGHHGFFSPPNRHVWAEFVRRFSAIASAGSVLERTSG